MARYQLRTAVRLQRGDDGAFVLQDRDLGRAVRLGAVDAKVVQALQKGATLAQLAKAAGVDEAEAARRLTGLARLYLLQGRRSQARLALQAERTAFAEQCAQPTDAEILEWPLGRAPPQHGCVGTGSCCSASFLGPLTATDARRVGELSFGRQQRFAAGAEVFETVDFGGRSHVGMRRDDQGRCVAQGDDLLCDIHAEHGAAAKPVACRQFPLRFYRSPRGVHVSLLLACDGYDRARDAAEAWTAREAEVRGLLGEGAAAVRAALPFEWSAGLPVPAVEWWRLRDELYALEPAERDAHAWLAAVLAAAEQALQEREAALREGPDVRFASQLGSIRQALDAPAQLYDAERAAAHLTGLRSRSVDLRRAGLLADAQRLADFATALQAQLDGLALRPRGALDASAQARQHLVDIVANDLQLQVALGHLDAGLANLGRRLLLAEALACALARAAGRDAVDATDTTRALHVVYRSEPDLTALAGLQRAA